MVHRRSIVRHPSRAWLPLSSAGLMKRVTVGATLLVVVLASPAAARWTVHRLPEPIPRTNEPQLVAVSCASTAACTAVGSSGVGALAERWDGVSWSIQTLPTFTGYRTAYLTGVSCPSTKVCIAVGYGRRGPLAERWNGSRWSVERTPKTRDTAGSARRCNSRRVSDTGRRVTRSARTLLSRASGS